MHHGTDPANFGWTRTFTYKESSQIEPTRAGPYSNRLTSTSTGNGVASSEGYHHDVHGNMDVLPPLQLVRWDYRNQLQATATQSVGPALVPEITYYRYDSAGQRVRWVRDTQAATVDSARPLEERIYLGDFEMYRTYDPNGVVTLERITVHIMDGEQRVALVETRTDPAATADPDRQLVRYQHANHLGSATLELDGTGVFISYEEYYPYGCTALAFSRAGTTPKRYRYSAKERDATGLSYHGARYYANWLGRWLSCDPAGAANAYGFAAENPSTKVDPDGAAEVPAEARRLLNDAATRLWGRGSKLDRGSNESILFEAQGGRLRGKTGRLFEHMQGVRIDVRRGREVSLEIDAYVGRAQGLSEETALNLKTMSSRLWEAADTAENTVAAAEVLQTSEYASRFADMELPTGRLISEQLATDAKWGLERTLLPQHAAFEGVIEGVNKLATRGSKPYGVYLYSLEGILPRVIESIGESAAWQRFAGRAKSASIWVGVKLSGLLAAGAKVASYLQYAMALQGGANAVESLMSSERNQKLNPYFTSRDQPGVGEQLLFQSAATGIGLIDAVAVNVKALVGDVAYGDYAFETYMYTGMSPAQRDFTEWSRVQLGMVPGPRR